MFRSSIEKKLTSVSKEMRSLREHLSMVDEQLRQVADEAEESRLRALVSETPLANAEHGEALKAVKTLQSDRAATLRKLENLEQKQDDLLDRLSATS